MKFFEEDVVEALPSKLKIITFQILGLLFDVLGVFGGLLVIYGWTSVLTKASWPIVDTYTKAISTYSTLAATLLISASIYIHTKPLPPSKASKWFTAPLVMAFIIGSVVFHVHSGVQIPVYVINGFAIAGLAGGLHRHFRTKEAQR